LPGNGPKKATEIDFKCVYLGHNGHDRDVLGKKNKKNLGKKLRVVWRGFLLAMVICLLVVAGLFMMVRKVPQNYFQPVAKTEQVSPYLTLYLAPNIHNSVQLDDPFEVIVPQDGINEIIAEEDLLGWKWPVKYGGIVISRPVAAFTPNTISLMGKVDLFGFEAVVTLCAMPTMDKDGMLSLNLQYVRAGSLDITYLAKSAIVRAIQSQITEVPQEYWLLDILGACRENKPFDPIFPASDGRYIRLIKSSISEKMLILIFEPSNKPEIADSLKDEKGS
jgi:hypothetical protein